MNRREVKTAVVMKLNELGFRDVRKGDADAIIDAVLGSMGGAGRIAIERERQITEECHNAKDDEKWDDGQLPLAAICYAMTVARPHVADVITSWWPWPRPWWKPSQSPIRNLEKAGALIAADLDRQEKGL